MTTPSSIPEHELLLALANRHSRSCRIFNSLRTTVHFCMLTTAALEATHRIEPYPAVVALLGFTGLSLFFHWRIKHSHTLARIARIRILLADSFGLKPSDLENDYALIEHGDLHAVHESRNALPDYYTSRLPAGKDRLRANLGETLFFAKNLYDSSRRSIERFLAFPTAIVLGVLISAPLLTSSMVLTLNRVLILTIVFLNEVEVITQRSEYVKASDECDRLFTYLRLKKSYSDSDILFVFGAYSALSAATPAPYNWAYKREREKLNALWSTLSPEFR